MGSFTGTTPVVLGGSVPDGTDWATILAQLTAENSAWTDYSSSFTWTGFTTNPVKGNAVIIARYRRVGKTVDVRVAITAGSTTTFGSGEWGIGLPFPSLDVANVGAAMLFDSSAGAKYAAVAFLQSAASIFYGTTPVGGPSAPFAWAVGDILIMSATYEMA